MRPNTWWRNFTMHNMVAHPLGEVLYLLGEGLKWVGGKLHDVTLPDHEPGEGRG